MHESKNFSEAPFFFEQLKLCFFRPFPFPYWAKGAWLFHVCEVFKIVSFAEKLFWERKGQEPGLLLKYFWRTALYVFIDG